MQVYFSHSYRDVAINGYFLEHFVDEEISLQADQKTDIWCVAKLERYMLETTGFVSIIPRRDTENDAATYSPYIGQEHSLARRARVPRLFFIDKQVLGQHRLDFPEDAVPFDPQALESGHLAHRTAIREFRQRLEIAHRPSRDSGREVATIVVGEGATLRDGAQDVAEILHREGYHVTLLTGNYPGRGLEDIRLLENLWKAEICIFILGNRLSDAHIALAMAHAHCIPSVRMQYDPHVTDCSPSITGMIRWRTQEEMLLEFSRQIKSYKEGLVQPVDLALASTATEAARSIATMRWQFRAENLWDMSDRRALIDHIHPNHSFVTDEVDRVRRKIGKALGSLSGREDSLRLCQELYDGLKRHEFIYEIEAASGAVGIQAIRTPGQIATHHAATCIDLVCLFASLLEEAGHNPLVLVVAGEDFAHALAGYRVLGEPGWENRGIGDVLGAEARGDAVFFEATGMASTDHPVAAETPEERRGKMLSFTDAQAAGRRMLRRSDISLRYFIDVRLLRQNEPPAQP